MNTEAAEAMEGLVVADMAGEVADRLAEMVEALAGDVRVSSFGEAGVLTRDDGFVLTTGPGREFQVTVVRSR